MSSASFIVSLFFLFSASASAEISSQIELLSNVRCPSTFMIVGRPPKRSLKDELERDLNMQVVTPLGEGGFGSVWLAINPENGKLYAVKAFYHNSAEAQRDMRIASKLRTAFLEKHPEMVDEILTRINKKITIRQNASVPFLETSVHRQGPKQYLLMEARGVSLSLALSRYGSSKSHLEDTNHVADQIVEAMKIAEDNHVLIRDLKPSNIQVDEQHGVHLIDQGLSLDLTNAEDMDNPPIAGTDSFVGSKAYGGKTRSKGDEVYSIQQTLRILYLSKYARDVEPKHAQEIKNGQFDADFSDFTESPATIDQRIPETISIALWLPFADVGEFALVWQKARENSRDPKKFYKWLKPIVDKKIPLEARAIYQRMGSSKEILKARRDGYLRFSKDSERKLSEAKREYPHLDREPPNPYDTPIPLIEVPAGIR
jgi:serine/threonine protein kinase